MKKVLWYKIDVTCNGESYTATRYDEKEALCFANSLKLVNKRDNIVIYRCTPTSNIVRIWHKEVIAEGDQLWPVIVGVASIGPYDSEEYLVTVESTFDTGYTIRMTSDSGCDERVAFEVMIKILED